MRVTLNPNLKTVAVRPTLKNPNIKVVVGQNESGVYEPKEILYPDNMTPDEVSGKVQRFQADYPKKGCPVCQRYAAEERTKNILVAGVLVVGGLLITSYLMSKKKVN